MSTYSIRDLEQLSGIKAHTLRIWEQRYDFIKPKRTDTNIRYYDDQDLKLILNVSLLKDNGHKISKISRMPYEQMQKEVLKLTDKRLSFPEQIHTLTLTMIDHDEERFEKIISTLILQLGFEDTMIKVMYPFLMKIGILWQTGSISPSQEHFISNLIRQKIIVAIDGLFLPSIESRKKYLLFLPEHELHEISLLFSAYLIKSRKNKIIYIGQNTPFDDLIHVYNAMKPDYLLTVMTSYPQSADVQDYVDKLSEKFHNNKILITGRQVVGQDIHAHENIVILNRLEDLVIFIQQDS
ncbi:MAG: MerR family transcriptional regulator [Cyclobacteriaceae bacterium]|nr:MerR family transcriptional regulator [Cyclobacteriaceae bacterium]